MDLKTLLLQEFETLESLISQEEKDSNEDLDQYFESIKVLIEQL